MFSDIPANRIYRWSGGAEAHVWREPSGQANGLAFDGYGRLIVCEHANRRVTRTENDGRIITLAEFYDGKRLNSPNDVVVAKDGTIYFTDPPYGVGAADRELDFQGVFRIPPDGGPSQLLERNMERPNGIGLSPDGRVLYVADSARMELRAFDLLPDGTLANGRQFAALAGPGGVADGLTVADDGRVFATGPGGVWVFDASGAHQYTVPVPEAASNCTLGGTTEEVYLYITARTSLYRVAIPRMDPDAQ